MVAYEFYWRDPIKGYQLIGNLPERRKSPIRITQESVINWGKKILGENVDANDIFFIKILIDKNTKGGPPLHPVYRPLKEF
jgi:hypothetical protein